MENANLSQNIQLESSWKKRLLEEFQKPYMIELKEFLKQEYAADKKIFPKGSEYFSALNFTPFENVKVVILGQDPYHGEGQAHGLCFSVRHGVKPPPSLQNIFKEIYSDLKITQPGHGCLESWAKQGVLLLNSVLTVVMGSPGSHQGRGWERFTDRVIELLNERADPLAFVLWGKYAQEKASFLDSSKHLVLKAPHPSPYSASNGFFGCKHFSQINSFLKTNGKEEINWKLELGV